MGTYAITEGMKASKFFSDFANAAAGNTITVLVARLLPIPLMTFLAAQCGRNGLCQTGLGIGMDTVVEVAFGLAVTAGIIAAKPYIHKFFKSEAAPLTIAAMLAFTTPHMPGTSMSVNVNSYNPATAVPALMHDPKAPRLSA